MDVGKCVTQVGSGWIWTWFRQNLIGFQKKKRQTLCEHYINLPLMFKRIKAETSATIMEEQHNINTHRSIEKRPMKKKKWLNHSYVN